MRWVFVRPRHTSPYYDPELQEPLGIEQLGACRRACGDSVLLLDGWLEGLSDERLARRAAAFQPDAVGFSVMTAREVPSVCAIHSECVRVLGEARVRWVAGGNFVSSEPDAAARLLPEAMRLVRFEGEHALDDLQTSEADAARTVVGRPVGDLETLPAPLRPFIDTVVANGWAVNLQGSRGCVGACEYCASPGRPRPEGGARWRGRSAAHIADELQAIQTATGARTFNFVDEDFLGPPRGSRARAEALLAEVRRRRLRASFGIQVRPASLTEDIVGFLTDAGVSYVFLGIESDDPTDFRRWGRPWTDDPWRFVRLFREMGADVGAGVLLFHPYSTLPKIRRFATKLVESGLLCHRTAVNRMDAMPGSALHARARADGLLGADVVGPRPLPFQDVAVEALFRDVTAALAPLGPPSMHAVCAMPSLSTRRRLDTGAEAGYRTLRRILADLDGATARTVFALLDHHEGGSRARGVAGALRAGNLEVAVAAAHTLVDRGHARSYDALRHAIRVDAGC